MPLLLYLFTMMIVGGRGYIWGPILGCSLLMLVDDLLRTQAEWRTVTSAIIIIGAVLFMRFGLAGLIEQLWHRYVVQFSRLRREKRERSMAAK
jgi:branched-chain amino acid transport system permease protein